MSPSGMPPGTPGMPPRSLSVIALVSGGKDSFFSLLHCLANGHRVVALANLFPEPASRGPPATTAILPGARESISSADEGDQDLNSFMYQTVGHQIVPLYADATGIPLYRRPITGSAAQDAKDYSQAADSTSDETEAMVPLLRAVMAAHPEADALCAGAILSTYQRTRVESVALRLGLTPLAYLWKFPVLSSAPQAPFFHSAAAAAAADDNDAQLLADMAAAGLEARVVKVATGGLDESFLWEDVASPGGVARIRKAMRRFGGAAGNGAILGEGGEFETLVVDGPRRLFRKRIVVAETDRRVVREGGGCAWLGFRGARVEHKSGGGGDVRVPDELGSGFASVLEEITEQGSGTGSESSILESSELLHTGPDGSIPEYSELLPSFRRDAAYEDQWCFVGDSTASIETETSSLAERIRARLADSRLPPTCVVSTVILLRDMADFSAVNKIYGALFPDPNPPSRVTIACGGALLGVNVAIYLLVRPELATSPSDRLGLHVQSRSYWAPANIGPYSQAVSVPLLEATSRTVHVAGQIPLVPATMDLPQAGSLERQLVLSLQHLWRIGIEMGVQRWASAVAYLSSSKRPVRERAVLAARAWTAAHRRCRPAELDDSDSDGPDLWDKKYDMRYAAFSDEDAGPPRLPDESVVASGPAPLVFAAEVAGLPRDAQVEWHAHAGFAGLGAASVRVVDDWPDASQTPASRPYHAQHTVVQGLEGAAVHSVLALGAVEAEQTEKTAITDLLDELDGLLRRRLPASTLRPRLLYVDSGSTTATKDFPIIPCLSLWDSAGQQLRAVAVYQEGGRRLSPR